MSKLAGGAASAIIPKIASMQGVESAPLSKPEQEPVIDNTQANTSSVPMGNPSKCLLVSNVFDPAVETEPLWAEDIAADMKDECAKFGTVKTCLVDEKNPNGYVYLELENASQGEAVAKNFQGRWFDKRCLQVTFLSEASFLRQCPRTAAA
mmetsp:Transcript_11958/g.21344  ORF Transcript_11958/g.21344 Transcript_11958/m.21344 type:complete len:151 (-) Transcript_11958:98-550(-)